MKTNIDSNDNYRYPGSRPFYDRDIDRRLFFGRDHEALLLLHQVLTGNLVVLYAKSGLGKTSLINAGLSQKLREKGFLPFKVRFNNPDVAPLQWTYEVIKNLKKQKDVDYDESGEDDSFWQFFKTAAFWKPGNQLWKPVMILDQFEEFFALHSAETRKDFTRQLADVVNNTVPAEVVKSFPPGMPFPYSDKPPNVKIIISIREDYLGELEEMSREIPDILHNRLRLLPLSRKQARLAIENPSQVKDEVFRAAPFKFSEKAVEKMLNFLCKRMEKDIIKPTDEVESFQLQLLCQYMENKAREKWEKGENEVILGVQDLGGETGMQKVLEQFYDDQIEQLDTKKQKEKCRKLCEEGLISVTDRRLSLEKWEIIRRFKVSEGLLQKLIDCRMLRGEPRVGSVYYELSHDTLVPPIRESQEKRNFKINAINKLYEEAGGLKTSRNYEKAAKKYSEILKLDETYVNAYLELGKIYYDKRQYDEAIKIYNKAVDYKIKHAFIYFRLGQTLYALGKTEEAIRYYRESLEQDPGLLIVYEGLGEIYENQKRYIEAIENYKEALKINKDKPDIYEKLAKSNIKNGEPDKAIEVYKQVVEINPGYANIYRSIVETLKEQGQNDYIDRIYDIASESKSRRASHFFNLGLDYTSLKNYEQAVKNYQKAIEIDPQYVYAYNNMGNVFSYMKKYDEAIETYKKAVKIDPKFAQACFNMGMVYHYLKKYKEAIKVYNRSIEIEPENIYAKVYLAEAYFLAGHFKKADGQANEMLKKKNISPKFILTMKFISVSSLLFRQKQLQAANQLKSLIKYYKTLSEDTEIILRCRELRDFIRTNKKLPPEQIDLLLQLVEFFEFPKEEGKKKLTNLESSIKKILKDCREKKLPDKKFSQDLSKPTTMKTSPGMNKTQLVKAIAGRTKLKLSDTEKMVNAFIETISEELKKKGTVSVLGFGTFAVAYRKEKSGINPKTGAKIIIPTKEIPVFKPGKALKELVK